MTGLQLVWYAVIVLFTVAYTVLAGIDLGLGLWLAAARDDTTRKGLFGGIGPIWDGNQVWLIAIGALLFTVFPPVYASLFSGFYLPVMAALFALIVRAVSIDFGLRATSPPLRARWAAGVWGGTLAAVLLLGVLFGDILRGLPLDATGNIPGTVGVVLHPFGLLCGALGVALVALYGATYAAWKGDDVLAARARRWMVGTWFPMAALLLAAVISAVAALPHLTENYRAFPALWLVPALGGAAALAVPLFRGARAFAAMVAALVLLLAAGVAGLFPRLVPAVPEAARSLTIANAAAGPKSLSVMLIILAVTLPLVVLGFIWSYRLFGGRLTAEEHY
jgi:cytochrome d ubiquinol oxidase subunit II